MDISNLNLLPDMIASGEITREEGIRQLASFINDNYLIFGLQKFDEDFRSEIVLYVLEKGNHLFEIYNSESGDFFTFFFCFIKSQIKSTMKKKSKRIINEKFSFQESVENYESDLQNYQKIKYSEFEIKRAPYNYKKVTIDDLKKGLQENKLERYDRSILVLALKSAYYLTDSQIVKICKIYDIEPDMFYDVIQYLRDGVLHKKERLEIYVQRRNSAYYHHKKYEEQIHYLEIKDNPNSELERKKLSEKNEVQKHNLNNYNKKFEDGYLYLRPSTKLVANVLGICERQINYYLQCVRKGKIDKEIIEKLEQEE